MSSNNDFLKVIEEENRVLEQELNYLLRKQQESLRFSFSKRQPANEDANENQCPNYNQNGDLSRIDEEVEEEQQHRVEPQRLQDSPQKYSTIDNLMDSINNYMHKRRSSQTEPQSHRASAQKKSDGEQKQIKSLEMRLSGTREALKALEKEVKEKNLTIQNLQIELHKKQKVIDQFQLRSNSNCSPHSKSEINVEGYQELKKQCKEWEKKFQESDLLLKENKKYMQRLQELNSQLLFKLKHYEQDKNQQNEEIDEIAVSLSKYESTIRNLQDQVQVEKDRYKQLEVKYEELKLSSEQFIQNSKDLKTQYEHMLNTLQQLANSV